MTSRKSCLNDVRWPGSGTTGGIEFLAFLARLLEVAVSSDGLLVAAIANFGLAQERNQNPKKKRDGWSGRLVFIDGMMKKGRSEDVDACGKSGARWF